MKTVVGQGQDKGMSRAGPAEGATAPYATAGSSRRVLPEGLAFYLSTVSTLLSPQGAGRIQPLRAFRPARLQN